jgi:GT2 family glycosyltransferase
MRNMGERRRLFLASADGNKVDLTVFIGTYNRLDQLKKAVETALSSAGSRGVEIIVNDAGSTDGTQQWLNKTTRFDKRVVPIFSGRRTSFTQAFNESLQIAKGQYICWLSDDIISEGNALSKMCDIMDGLSPADMGGFCVRNSWSHEYTVRQDSGFHFPTVGCMYTETLRKMNGINMDYPYYAQDTELDMRVLKLGGRIVACDGCRLLHDCRNDGLRVSNSHNHTRTMGDLKFLLAAWHPGKPSIFPYPTILLVPAGGCGPSDIVRTAHAVRTQYSNAHLFVGGEASAQLDVSGPNSFLCKVPTAHGKAASLFDLVIEVGPTQSLLVKPANKASTPFVGKMLMR